MNLLDFILNLFRSPQAAQAFVADPDDAMRLAGVPPASAAQIQAVAATAAPAGVVMGGGDPVVGLQRAVSDHHNIASPFSPVSTFAPQTQTEAFSRNNTEVASNNAIASPDQAAGANAQNGAFNLGFGDITLGDKTTNTASDGGVVNTGTAGNIDTTNVEGDGNVVGNEGTNANTGDIEAGDGSNINVGEGNKTDDDGVILKDVDTTGGNGGKADAEGGIIGGGEATGGAGGAGGGIEINRPGDDDDAEAPEAEAKEAEGPVIKPPVEEGAPEVPAKQEAPPEEGPVIQTPPEQDAGPAPQQEQQAPEAPPAPPVEPAQEAPPQAMEAEPQQNFAFGGQADAGFGADLNGTPGADGF